MAFEVFEILWEELCSRQFGGDDGFGHLPELAYGEPDGWSHFTSIRLNRMSRRIQRTPPRAFNSFNVDLFGREVVAPFWGTIGPDLTLNWPKRQRSRVFNDLAHIHFVFTLFYHELEV